MMEFIIGFAVGAVVSGVAFIVFHKNNMRKINKARETILESYKGSGLEEVANKVVAKFDELSKGK